MPRARWQLASLGFCSSSRSAIASARRQVLLCLLQIALGALEFTHVRQGQREVELVVGIPREFGEKPFAKRDRVAVGLGGVLGQVEHALDVGHLAVGQSRLANDGRVARPLAEKALVELRARPSPPGAAAPPLAERPPGALPRPR